MTPGSGDASTIKFGARLSAVNEGAGVVRVDADAPPAPVLELIADVTIDALDTGGFPIEGAPTSFDIDDIPQTYGDLLGVMFLRSTAVGTGTALVRFNGDTGARYYRETVEVTNDTVSGDEFIANDAFRITIPGGAAASAKAFAHATFVIPGYSSNLWLKTIQIDSLYPGGTAAGTFKREMVAGFWQDTTPGQPVDRLTVGDSAGLVDGSRLRLYGRL